MDAIRVANKLKELRGDKSQVEVSDALGITPAALANYEAGIRIPRDDIKLRIAQYYKCTVESIFFDVVNHES